MLTPAGLAVIFPAVSTLTVLAPSGSAYITEYLGEPLSRFTRLTALSLGGHQDHHCTERALWSLAPIAAQLRHLKIYRLSLRARDRHKIPLLRNVATLQLVDVDVRKNPNVLGRLLSRFPTLQSLCVTSVDDVALSMCSLRRVQLEPDGWQVPASCIYGPPGGRHHMHWARVCHA